jgi:SAM-dependent methyltransferase
MALALSPSFEHTTALDPSAKMVSIGLQPDASTKKHISYAVGSAEDLSSLPAHSVDLVVAGQAAHWFDHQRAWSQIGHVLRPGGTVAYVVSRSLLLLVFVAVWWRRTNTQGYGEMFFPTRPRLNRLISEHQGGAAALGPHWSQPGRRIVEGLLDAVPFPVEPAPESAAEVLSRLPNLYDDGGYPVASRIPEPAPVAGTSGWDAASAVRIKNDSSCRQYVLTPPTSWGWGALEGYLRTASALHAYHEAHPGDKARIGQGAKGDIVDRLVCQLQRGLEEETGREAQTVEVAWPLVLMMVKKTV